MSARPLSVALLGHVGNSVLVRGGLEVHLDAMVEALRARGVDAVSRLGQQRGRVDLVHFVGSFYGLDEAFDAAFGLPRLVMPILLHSDSSLAWWRGPADLLRARFDGSLLHTRRRMLQQADLVVANSAFEEAEARAWGARRTAVVPAGVDLEHFRPGAAAADQLPPEWRSRAEAFAKARSRVVSVGRLERRKNQREVLAAARLLGAQAVFIGRRSPSEPRFLDELSAQGGGEVVWEDAPSEVVLWALRTADVHVLATRHETAGLVSMEAAACGCRPVAIDQPTAREYLSPFGELARSPSPGELAGAIARAQRRGRLSGEERSHLERFSWPRIAEQLEAHYRGLLRGR